MGGYTMPSTRVALADERDAAANDDVADSDDENDSNASSPNDDEMST